MITPEDEERRHKHQEIAARTFHRWEMAGRHHHRDLEYWLQAESELGAALTFHPVADDASEAEWQSPSPECVSELVAPAW